MVSPRAHVFIVRLAIVGCGCRQSLVRAAPKHSSSKFTFIRFVSVLLNYLIIFYDLCFP